jgi:hypothetical protein
MTVRAPERPARVRRVRRLVVRVTVDWGVPLGAYYLLRWLGWGVYAALLVSTLLSALPAALSLRRDRRLDGLSVYMTTMLLASIGVALLSGSTRFLLAKEALLTGATGIWFLASTVTGRPLSFLFSRPLLEGRLGWPGDWDTLWERYPRFRRMWRVSSVLFGLGTLGDAIARVVMAYTLPPDSVPALGTVLYAVTSGVLIVVTNVYYIVLRVGNPHSRMYR